jgi:hypothetical protein
VSNRERVRGPLVIRLSMDKVEPSIGRAATEAGAEVEFDGWLGLLGAISMLTGSPHAGERLRDEDAGQAGTRVTLRARGPRRQRAFFARTDKRARPRPDRPAGGWPA